MAKRMLIDASHPEETRVVVVDGNKIEEFDFESQAKKLLRGNIYLAKVTRVEPSLQAAFIQYGGNKHGFLAFSEIHPDYYQIPVADRERLLQAQAEAARREEDEDSRPNRSGRGGRRRGAAKRGHRGPSRRQEEASADPSTPEEGAQPDIPENAFPAEGVAENPSEATGTGAEEASQNTDHAETAQAARSDEEPPALAEDLAKDNGTAGTPASEASSSDAEASKKQDGDGDDPQAQANSENHQTGNSEETGTAAAPESDDSGEEAPGKEASSEDAASEEAAPTDRMADDDDADDEEDPESGSVEVLGGDDQDDEDADRRRRTLPRYKIQEVIRNRQILLVQVAKEERGNKGAALTTYLSLAGRYCVLMPNTAKGGGISRKITNPSDRKRLKAIAQELEVPEGMGLIIRTAGANRTKAEIKRDFEYLLRLWESVRELTLRSTAPALVYEEGNLTKKAIRDLYSKEIDTVYVEGDEAYKEAKAFMRMLMPSHAKNVQPYKDRIPLFQRYQVEQHLDSMFSPKVELPSGGYVIINQTEALVAIDVNSGRSTREHSIEETALKTNLEAAEEIARQMRLRDLAGLIVIDFIDMEENRNDRAVERKLKDCLKNDRARLQVGRISNFGLLEMSRQRMRAGVLEGSTQACPHCEGTGLIRGVESLSLRILRACEEEGLRQRSASLTVYAPAHVCIYLLNHKRDELTRMKEDYYLTVYVEIDAEMGTQDYRLERGDPLTEIPKPRTETVSLESTYADQEAAEADDLEADDEEEEDERAAAGDDADEAEDETGAEAKDDTQDDSGRGRKKAAEGDEDGSKRRRRRGKRGGRRNRRKREDQGQEDRQQNSEGPAQEAASSPDESSADKPSEAAPADAPQPAEHSASAEAGASAVNGSGGHPSATGAGSGNGQTAEGAEDRGQADEPAPDTPPPGEDDKPKKQRKGWWQRRFLF